MCRLHGRRARSGARALLLVLAALAVFVGCGSDGETRTVVERVTVTTPAPAADAGADGEEATDVPEPAEDLAAGDEIGTGAPAVGKGKTLRFPGEWDVKAESVRVVDGVDKSFEVVEGHFAIVALRVTNRTNRTHHLNLGYAYRLTTEDGASYEPSIDASDLSNTDMAPNVPKVQRIAFEIPPGAKPGWILVAPTPDGDEYAFLDDADYGQIALR